jgi:hypothetical protein
MKSDLKYFITILILLGLLVILTKKYIEKDIPEVIDNTVLIDSLKNEICNREDLITELMINNDEYINNTLVLQDKINSILYNSSKKKTQYEADIKNIMDTTIPADSSISIIRSKYFSSGVKTTID